jgi:SAM-dependent methyltransferase
VTITPDDPRRVFAHIDRTALAPEIMAYLETVAELPEILAWRAVADDLMAMGPGLRVLDAGCGLGDVARRLAAAVGPGGDVTAIDVSERMVDAARSRDAGAGVTYEVADVTDLPYASGSFDRSRCERVLQHLTDPDAALAELVRVTAAGGMVCVLDSDWRSVAVDVDEPGLSGAVLAAMDTVSPQPDLGRTLRRRLVRAGLVDVEVRVHPIPTPHRRSPPPRIRSSTRRSRPRPASSLPNSVTGGSPRCAGRRRRGSSGWRPWDTSPAAPSPKPPPDSALTP